MFFVIYIHPHSYKNRNKYYFFYFILSFDKLQEISYILVEFGDILSGFQLKMIALVTMLTDHIGAIFYPDMIALRVIGRIAFPIYCFLLVQGFLHTSNLKIYDSYGSVRPIIRSSV